MTTPIRPSLAQLLGTPQTVAPKPQTAEALSAQRHFFRQALNANVAQSGQVQQPQTVAPPTFKAADIARVTTPVSGLSGAGNSEPPIARPGTYLNIRV